MMHIGSAYISVIMFTLGYTLLHLIQRMKHSWAEPGFKFFNSILRVDIQLTYSMEYLRIRVSFKIQFESSRQLWPADRLHVLKLFDHLISPHNIIPESNIRVTRIKETRRLCITFLWIFVSQTCKNMVFFSTCACVNYFSKALERWALCSAVY